MEQRHQTLDADIERALWMSHEEMLASSARMRSPLVLASVERYPAERHYPLEMIY